MSVGAVAVLPFATWMGLVVAGDRHLVAEASLAFMLFSFLLIGIGWSVLVRRPDSWNSGLLWFVLASVHCAGILTLALPNLLKQ